MTVADQVAAWVAAQLTWLPDRAERVVVVPALALLTYWALRIVLDVVLPRVLATFAYRIIPAAVHVAAAVMLAVEFLTTQLFRLVRVRPAVLVYGFGDAVVRTDGRLSAASRSSAATAWRLRNIPRPVLAIAAGYLVYRWGIDVCQRATSSPCVSPTGLWWSEVESLLPFLSR